MPCGTLPDWTRDPVHHRRPASGFWASVPYLDARSGDHKIIWELNRHQHWLALGRAYWLTGDARYRTICVDQLEHWLDSNPPLTGINWASMLELAFRAISWTYALEFFATPRQEDAHPWSVDLLVGLDRQLAHVAHNLSRYFSPNTHLTGEALALYAVSLALPELRQSAERAAVGREVLVAEASRQIRADGGHAELSAHYHRYSTDFYLLATLVARAGGDPAAETFERAARAQAEYLRTIAADDGRLPLIGDDDGGQLFAFGDAGPADGSPTLAAAAHLFEEPSLVAGGVPAETAWILGAAPRLSIRMASRASWPSRLLPASGYFVSRSGEGDQMILDAGPHGFLNGGHAHADALSVSLVAGGVPVFVDPGTGTYTMDLAARDRFRSPRMHNTVVIDGQDFASPQGPFHWASRTDARLLATSIAPGLDFAQATHDGYAPARHVRTMAALHGCGWLIVDHVFGDGDHTAEAWWHLHPDWTVRASDGEVLGIEHVGGMRLTFATTAASAAVLTDDPFAVYAPEYGRIERAPAIRITQRSPAPYAIGTFVPSAAHDGKLVRIAALPVTIEPGALFAGAAFLVTLGDARLVVLVAAPSVAHPAPWHHPTWGVDGLRTNARFAAGSTAGDVMTSLGLVDGDALHASSVAESVH